MIPEIGLFLCVLALALAVVQVAFPTIGLWRRDAAWLAMARPAARAQFACLLAAFAVLVHAFLVNDF